MYVSIAIYLNDNGLALTIIVLTFVSIVIVSRDVCYTMIEMSLSDQGISLLVSHHPFFCGVLCVCKYSLIT